MLRRFGALLTAAASPPPARCVAALAVPLDDARFWDAYRRAASSAANTAAAPTFAAAAAPAHPATTAVLECLAAPHVACLATATAAVQRWTELDNDDCVAALIAYSAAARANLADAIICHQQSTVFVAHACRAIANAALLPSATPPGGDATGPEAAASPAAAPGSNAVAHIAHLATHRNGGVIDVLLRTLVRPELTEVADGRGPAWVLQALQNMALHDATAAHCCAAFASGSSSCDAESTAEHHVSVAVLRALAAFRDECPHHHHHQQPAGGLVAGAAGTADEREQAHREVMARRRTAAIDSGLACIAWLLAMSVDGAASSSPASGGGDTATQMRSERASHSVFRAVAEALNSAAAASSVEVQHKAWECARLIVAAPAGANIPPLLAALHAADGMSGMRILQRWLAATLADMPACVRASSAPSGRSGACGDGDGDGTPQHTHELRMRAQCGLDVIIELTAAAVAPAVGQRDAQQHEQLQDEQRAGLEHGGAADDGSADDATAAPAMSATSDSAATVRWDTAMMSITNGALSAFAVQLLTALHQHKILLVASSRKSRAANDDGPDATEESLRVAAETRLKCLTLLTNLSQTDTFVRGANCLAALQRVVVKPVIEALQQHVVPPTRQDHAAADLALSDEDAVALQKTMSIVWNALNFKDAVATVRTLGLREDLALIVKCIAAPAPSAAADCAQVGARTFDAGSAESAAAAKREQLRAAAERLLEKMRVTMHVADGKH